MLKTLTFTIMHFCIAFAVTYALTGSVAASSLVAAIEPLCNSVGSTSTRRSGNVSSAVANRRRSAPSMPGCTITPD